MTGVLNVDTIADNAGTGPVSLTKQNAAKSWSSFNGTGTVALRDSLNVSSLTDFGTGQYKTNFTNNMSDSNYTGVSHVNNRSDTNPGSGWMATWSTDRTDRCTVEGSAENTGNIDGAQSGTIVHGDLA